MRYFTALLFLILAWPSNVIAQLPGASSKSMAVLRDEGGCYSYELLEPGSAFLKGKPVRADLGWTTSGMWRGDELLLVDLTFQRVPKLKIQQPGRMLESGVASFSYADPTRTPERLQAPWYVSQREDGSALLIDLLDDKSNHILFIGKDGKLLGKPFVTRKRIQKGTNKGDIIVTGVYRMASFGDDAILAAIDYEPYPGDRNTYSTAFAYMDRDEVIILDLGQELKESMALLGDMYYSRDLVPLAVVNGVGYILIYDKEPWVGRVDLKKKTVEPLASFPENFSGIPQLKKPITKSQHEFTQWYFKIYSSIESSAMLHSIYSWRGRLLALAKTAKAPKTGSTTWSLIELSQETGQSTGFSIELPSHAEQIALVPGPDFFGIIERGAINLLDSYPRTALYRPTRSTVIFPTSWLSNPIKVKSRAACERVDIVPH